MALQVGRVGHNDSFANPRTREVADDSQRSSDDMNLDALSQLNANILQLEDLHGRLRFMMTEVEKLVRRRT